MKKLLCSLLFTSMVMVLLIGCGKSEAISNSEIVGSTKEDKEMSLSNETEELGIIKEKEDTPDITNILTEMEISQEDAEKWDEILANEVWQNMLISLEGVPMDLTKATVGTFLDCGWVIKEEDISETTEGYSAYLYLNGNEEKKIDIEFKGTPDGMNYAECPIISIHMRAEYGADYCLAGGITKNSTQQELALKYGCPVFENYKAIQRENSRPQSETWIYMDDYNYRFLDISFSSTGLNISMFMYDTYENCYDRLSSLKKVIETENNIDSHKIQFAKEDYPDYEWGEMKADYGVERLSERETRTVENYTILNNINNGLVLYLPNADWTKLECINWDGGALSTDSIILELKNRGVLPSDVKCSEYYNFSRKYRGLILDEAFITYLGGVTKEQEEMILTSLAFSVGANWGVKTMYLDMTGNGTSLMTKYCLYDEAVTPEAFYYLFE